MLERTRELREAKSIAENANRQKTRFLTAATHDIRQPLQALGLLSETLQYGNASTGTSVTAGKMRRAIGHLIELFERLFDLSKIDNDLIQAQSIPSDPSKLLVDFAESLTPLCKSAQVSLHLVTDTACRSILTDPVMLKRSLMILADNALQHARCQNLILFSESTPKGCRFILEDDGIGIPECERGNVFEEFYQIRNPERNRLGGMGLGLALGKRLVELMGGQLLLEPRTGEGCRFVIVQPWSPASVVALPKPTRSQPENRISSLRVLVIDDDIDAFEALLEVLQLWGMECRGGMTVKSGLDCIQDGWQPDITFLDYRLPGMLSGIDLADELVNRIGDQLSVIIITGAPTLCACAHPEARWQGKPQSAQRPLGGK